MPRILSPFKAGSYTYVLHAGVTDRAIQCELADPAYCGSFTQLPEDTAFIAYKRMLAVSPHDGYEADGLYELFVGNVDHRVHYPMRDGQDPRLITFLDGEHEGAKFNVAFATTDDRRKVSSVRDWGVKGEPSSQDERTLRLDQWIGATPQSRGMNTIALDHRVFRHIPPGKYIRASAKPSGEYGDPAFERTLSAMRILNLYDVRDPEKWIASRLRDLSALVEIR